MTAPRVTNEDRKNLDIRAAVPSAVRSLLSRAKGLELLAPHNDAEYFTKLEHLAYELQPNETFAGFDFEADIDHCKVVLVMEEVNYPYPGVAKPVFNWE